MTWVLPEKYEEGLLDEKGEPLSKRCAVAMASNCGMPLRLRQAQPPHMQPHRPLRDKALCSARPLQRVQAPPEAGAEGEGDGGEEGAATTLLPAAGGGRRRRVQSGCAA